MTKSTQESPQKALKKAEPKRLILVFVLSFLKILFLVRTQPDKPLLWLAEWLRKNNPQTSKLDDEGK